MTPLPILVFAFVGEKPKRNQFSMAITDISGVPQYERLK